MSDIVALPKADLDSLLEHLEASAQFFVSRDEMNAQVHLDETRYSPITVDAVNWRNWLDELMGNDEPQTG